MHHIDEHTLEMYVLGSDSSGHRQIEEHLKECYGCRDIADRIAQFYIRVGEELAASSASTDAHTQALVRQTRSIEPWHESNSIAISLRRITGIRKFQHYMRRHPVMTGTATFAVLAGLALIATSIFTMSRGNVHPSYHFYNPTNHTIEIRNALHQKLWELPSQDVTQAMIEYFAETKCDRTVVADVDSDGENEILTLLHIGGEDIKAKPRLRIYNAQAHLRLERTFTEPFKYLDRDYSPEINMGVILVGNFSGNGGNEIWLTGNSFNRSPTVVLRMDAGGNTLGKFWHFGQCGIYALDLDKNGTTEIILTGINDRDDTNHREFPALVVLDPHKVVGEGVSTATPGFAFPPSNAELYYVGFPSSDLDSIFGSHSGVWCLQNVRADAVHFSVKGTSLTDNGKYQYEFEYIFNRDMSVREVKSNNPTDRLHDLLVEQGRLDGKIDKPYLEMLRNGVRYWNGNEWEKRKAAVRHDVQTAAPG